MPTVKDHKTQAERNYAVYQQIPDTFPDWKAVALFYCALHVVEMVAQSEGYPCHNHDEREYKFLRVKHPKIWEHYSVLFRASRRARYMAGGVFDMNSGVVDQQLSKRRLHTIIYWAMEQLGYDSFLGLTRITKEEQPVK